MSKLHSFGWGILSSLVGGVIVLALLYFLYLKKHKVQVTYLLLGFFAVTLILFIVAGGIIFFGYWGLM